MRDQVRLHQCFEYCYNLQQKGKEINSYFVMIFLVALWENNTISETIL